MLARIVHNLSKRSKGPFVAVNMASFSNTLFLDEITELSGGLFQGKILRVVQEREFYLLRERGKREIDLRIHLSHQPGYTRRD